MKLHTTIHGLPLDLEGSVAELKEFVRELNKETNTTQTTTPTPAKLTYEDVNMSSSDPYPSVSDFVKLLNERPKAFELSLREVLGYWKAELPKDPKEQPKLYMRWARAKSIVEEGNRATHTSSGQGGRL